MHRKGGARFTGIYPGHSKCFCLIWPFIFSQEESLFPVKLVDWNIGFHGAKFSKKLNYLVLNDADVKSNARQMAALWWIFILQQIKFRKNGFHRLVDWNIGFYCANFLRNSIIWRWMTLIFVKLLISQVSTSNQMRGKWPLFGEFSFFSKLSFGKTVFTDL